MKVGKDFLVYPNLLVIGGQKCGSTWLYSTLKHHPDVFMSETKELAFFDNKQQTKENIVEYLNNFKGANSFCYRGEATPGYFCIPAHRQNVPLNVRNLVGGDVRLILSLRDPIERAISAFFHHFRAGRINAQKGFRDQSHIGGIVEFGRYRNCFTAWERYFAETAFFITYLEDIRADHSRVSSELFSWLGLNLQAQKGFCIQANSGFELALEGERLVIASNSGNAWNRRFWTGALKSDPSRGSPFIEEKDLEWLQEEFQSDIDFVQRTFGGRSLEWGKKTLVDLV